MSKYAVFNDIVTKDQYGKPTQVWINPDKVIAVFAVKGRTRIQFGTGLDDFLSVIESVAEVVVILNAHAEP